MFSIQKRSENGFHIIKLTDEKSKCFAEITPACGGILHAFGSEMPGKEIQVLDQFESAAQFNEQVEELGYKSCKLSPFVCRMQDSSFTFGEKKYQLVNRSPGKYALHGLLYNKSFLVLDEIANEQHASVSLKYQYNAEEPGYPFIYDCIITYELAGDCKLHLRTEIINHSPGLIPIQDGWHPYFDLGDTVDHLELEFQSKNKLVFNKELLPTGEMVKDDMFDTLKVIGNIHFDNCYELDMQECQPLCVLRNKEKHIEIQIFPENDYSYLQIYTPPDRKSVAIENLSGPPNAFNLGYGFITLEPGQSTVFNTAYRIHFLN